MEEETLKVAIAQIAPVWLDRKATLEKVMNCMREAASEGTHLLVFGEALIPGYPFWVDQTDGARFDNDLQKDFYAHYQKEAVSIEEGHLDELLSLAKECKLSVYLGIIERPTDRGAHSLYCTLLYINSSGEIASSQRKLMPTYEERLVWGIGDGHGLCTHPIGSFTAGGLNCWENWLPLARASLYAQGEDLHVSVWPGNYRNTHDLIPVLAKEGRSYVIAASGLFSHNDLHEELPHADILANHIKGTLANGGSCIAAPDGSWVLEPVTDKEGVFYAELDHQKVRSERLNIDVSGHYSRPDVFQLQVDMTRQSILKKKT